MAQSRYWLGVLNNPEIAPVYDEDTMQYMVYQGEMGESGTPHYQIYIQLKRNQRMSYLRKLLPGAHWEIQQGTNEQAREYSMKDDEHKEGHQSIRLEGPFEYGEFKETRGNQGSRSDLLEIILRIKEGVKR